MDSEENYSQRHCIETTKRFQRLFRRGYSFYVTGNGILYYTKFQFELTRLPQSYSQQTGGCLLSVNRSFVFHHGASAVATSELEISLGMHVSNKSSI